MTRYFLSCTFGYPKLILFGESQTMTADFFIVGGHLSIIDTFLSHKTKGGMPRLHKMFRNAFCTFTLINGYGIKKTGNLRHYSHRNVGDR
ncbi:hypothetical protein D3C80_1679490 [compost metagenome]